MRIAVHLCVREIVAIEALLFTKFFDVNCYMYRVSSNFAGLFREFHKVICIRKIVFV